MNNTVVLLVVSRSRTVVTLNREFLFFNATYTTLVVERKKIITPLYMDAGA